MISSAMLGLDIETVIVNGKPYIIKPPTIGVIAAAGNYLSEIGDGKTIGDVLRTMVGGAENAAKALSCFIQGDDGLYEELKDGTYDEIIIGLEKAVSMLSAENFIRLSGLTRSVTNLIARPK